MASFTAKVTEGSSSYEITFTPAPADERPVGETSGCSHFVAKAPKMSADAPSVTVEVALTLAGKTETLVWKGFVPKKSAHHIE